MSYEKLKNEALKVLGDFPLAGADFTAGSVASALLTEDGNIFTGICIDIACGVGFCAEHSAIAEMLKNRETRIKEIIAINSNNTMPPCGRCRELMFQVNEDNIDTKVHLSESSSALLSELLPYRWDINA